jgi:hypothetical protein
VKSNASKPTLTILVSVPVPYDLVDFFSLILSANAFLFSNIGSSIGVASFITISGFGGVSLDNKSLLSFLIA